MTDSIPAATLVLFRDGEGAPPDLLLVERARTLAFAGGALVFPGGRVDPGDHVLAAGFGGDPDDLAARIAAIRETLEEVGVGVGLSPVPPAALSALRSGADFGAVLADYDVLLDPAVLTPFARWLPDHAAVRIFDARFYLAALPADAAIPTIDATENVRLLWSTAQGVLDLADAGAAHIIFPTRCNLERLAQFSSFAAAAAHAAATPIRTITPWIERRGGVDHLCIPVDLGYPITSQPLAEAMRG